jgi:outer membrane lipoprotein carrier protein
MRFIILAFISILAYALSLPKEFSANFTQHIFSNDKNLTYKGKIFYKNKELVWKYTYPTEKIIWIKDKVYIYEPDLYQVTITKRKKLTLDKIVKNSKKIGKNLYLSKINNKKIYFLYDKTLQKLYYTDELGNKVEIKFYNQKNYAPKKVFEINFPNDVDYIYQG